MGKIKGWKKMVNSSYGSRVLSYEYFNVEEGASIRTVESNTAGIWSVQLSYGETSKSNSGFVRYFETKNDAEAFMMNYMRSHPRG